MTSPEIPRYDDQSVLEQRVLEGALNRDNIKAIEQISLAPDVTIGSCVKANIATKRWKYDDDDYLVIDYEYIASRLSLNDEEQEALRVEVLLSRAMPEDILMNIIRDGLGIEEDESTRNT